MYRGEISVPQERLQILIQAGESLQIRGLVDHSITENVNGESVTVDRIDDNSISAAVHLNIPFAKARDQAGLLRPNDRDNQRTTPAATHPIDTNNRETNCTSPMPRRKQARPRRRSGECGPHDLSSKPSSPISFNVAGGASVSVCPDPIQLNTAEPNRVDSPIPVQPRLVADGAATAFPVPGEHDDAGSDMDEEEMDDGRDDDIIDHDEFDEEDEEVWWSSSTIFIQLQTFTSSHKIKPK